MLYVAAGSVAAFENIFPPFPSDVVVAFAVFLTARGGGPFWTAAIVTWIGNVLGAMLMYYVGKRYGSLILLEKLEHFAGKRATVHLQSLHAKYGLWALFISRFLPGVRALVPPFAGAMGLPAGRVTLAVAAASGIWYAIISYLAFKAGERWDTLLTLLSHSTKLVAIIAGVVAVISVVFWYIRHRKAKQISAISEE